MLHFLINTAQAVSLPDFSKAGSLPAFISSIYSFALTVVGIAVFIRILYAGFLMLTAAGNASKWSDAKTKMQNAVIGTILLFSAYLILYVINPDLVKNTFNFSLPTTAPAAVTKYACNSEGNCVVNQSEGTYINDLTCGGKCVAAIKTYTCDENGQCVEDPIGEYDTPDCDNDCVAAIKTYTCDENGQCVEDPIGEYDTSNCDDECL